MTTHKKIVLAGVHRKVLFVLVSVIAAAGLFVLGLYIGFAHRPYVSRVMGVSNTATPGDITADMEPFWKVWNIIDEKYPDASKDSAQDRVYGAIKGLIGSTVDPYSVFFPPQDAADFANTISGSFVGIGIEVGEKDNVLTVIAPLKNTPAETAGIKAGDQILKIDGTSTAGMTIDKAVDLIHGAVGTSVVLTIEHSGVTASSDISVTRSTIAIPTLDSEQLPNGVFIISLYNFDATSSNLMTAALKKFAASGSKDLVIDLRGNPGGYLDSAVDIGSYFLPEGDTIVTEDFGQNGAPRVYRSKGYDLLSMKNIKVAVLVDKGSASAAEILAGALNEHGVAPLIGQTTYGKGSVQEVMNVTDDTTLKITVAKWLTPDGTSISQKGLDPTIPVTLSSTDTADHSVTDSVFQRALQYFNTGS